MSREPSPERIEQEKAAVTEVKETVVQDFNSKSLDELVEQDQSMPNKKQGIKFDSDKDKQSNHSGGKQGYLNKQRDWNTRDQYQDRRPPFQRSESGGMGYQANKYGNAQRRSSRSSSKGNREERGYGQTGGRGSDGFGRGGYRGFREHDRYDKNSDEREARPNVRHFEKNYNNDGGVGRRVFVSNLSYETQWKYLKDHMRQAGDVVRADIFEDEKGRSRGIGVVEYRNRGDMERAIAQMSQTLLDGRKLFVKEDTENHVLPPLTKAQSYPATGGNQNQGLKPQGHQGNSYERPPSYERAPSNYQRPTEYGASRYNPRDRAYDDRASGPYSNYRDNYRERGYSGGDFRDQPPRDYPPRDNYYQHNYQHKGRDRFSSNEEHGLQMNRSKTELVPAPRRSPSPQNPQNSQDKTRPQRRTSRSRSFDQDQKEFDYRKKQEVSGFQARDQGRDRGQHHRNYQQRDYRQGYDRPNQGANYQRQSYDRPRNDRDYQSPPADNKLAIEKAPNNRPKGYSIKIGNLPVSVDSDQLKKAFKSYGAIYHSNVPQSREGDSLCYGFIEFEQEQPALKAIKEMDRAKFNGQLVTVEKKF